MTWFIWAIALSLTLVVGIAIGSGRSVVATVKDYVLWFGLGFVVAGIAIYLLIMLLRKT